MALNFYTQGIDFSGLGQGIAKGIDELAKYNYTRQQEFKKEIDNFKNNYDNKNLKPDDIPEFTSAFDLYKEKALQYSRANKGLSKDKNIAVYHQEMEAAKANMNNIYSNSAKAKEYMSSLLDYSKNLSAKGYKVPKDISDRYSYFVKTPSSSIKNEEYVNPYEIDIAPNTNDYRAAQMAFNSIPKGVDVDEIGEEEVDMTGVGKIKIPKLVKYKKADSTTSFTIGKTFLNGNDRVYNEYKDKSDDLLNSLSITDEQINQNPDLATVRQNAMSTVQTMQSKIGNEFDPTLFKTDDLAAYMAGFDFGAFDKVPQGAPIYDESAFKRALKLQGIDEKDKKFNEAVRQFGIRTGLQARSVATGEGGLELRKTASKKTSVADMLKLALAPK